MEFLILELYTKTLYLQLAQPPFTLAKSHLQLAFWPQLAPL